jgi:hypothetical protein
MQNNINQLANKLKKQAVAEFKFDNIFPFAGVCTKSAAIYLFINRFL